MAVQLTKFLENSCRVIPVVYVFDKTDFNSRYVLT